MSAHRASRRWPPHVSSSSRNCENVEATDPAPPAVSSTKTEVRSAAPATATRDPAASSTARVRSVAAPAAPACTTTPVAPMASASVTVALARLTDRRRKSSLGDATLTM